MIDQVVDRIIEELAGQADPDAGALSADSEFEAIGIDSLVLVELSIVLNREYGVEVDDEDLAASGTIGSAARLVTSRRVAV